MNRRDSIRARFSRTTVLLTVLLIASPLFASPSSFWPETPERLQRSVVRPGMFASQANHEIGIVHAETGAPIRAFGNKRLSKMAGTASTQSVLQFIDSHQSRFGISSNELEVLHSGQVLGKYYLTARQTIDNRPVLGTTVLLRVHPNGNVSLYGADVETGQRGRSFTSGIDQQQAAEALAAFAETPFASIEYSQQVWVRLEGELYPAWQLTLVGKTPLERPHGLVSVESGEILGYYNDVQHADVSGTVTGPIYPIRMQDPVSRVPFSEQYLSVGGNTVTTDEDGHFSQGGFTDNSDVNVIMTLAGPWVRVANEDQEDAYYENGLVAPFDGDFDWLSPEQGRMDEFNVFYHTNIIHAFYDVLDPDFTGLDFQVLATVGVGDHYDNAYWAGNQMAFGVGAQLNNLALFSDVIYHEYTHGVTGRIYPHGLLPYTGQSGAMNEAWSDYFPCSIHDHSTVAPGIYASSSNSPLRDLDNRRRYPENIVDEVHVDGLIVGGAMWDLRQMIGDQEYSDSLIHFARYGLATNFQNFLLEVLEADDDNGDISDGTPHSADIYAAFGQHGIGPGHVPNIVATGIGVQEEEPDDLLQPGETVDIHMSLLNDVYLYPPAARNVTVTATAGEWIVWTRDEDVVESIDPGEEVDLPQGFSFTVREGAPASFDWIRFTISANDGEFIGEDSLRVTLGVPEILLVNDGGDPNYMYYFTRALSEIETGALVQNTHETPVTSNRLASYPYVIWFTGDAIQPISLEEETQLVEYVEAGGHLIMSGQYIGPQLQERISLRTILGVQGYESGLDEYGGRGAAGEPLGTGITFVILGTNGASNQRMIGGLTLNEGTRGLLTFFNSHTYAACYNVHELGGSAAFYSFGLEAVTGISTSNTAGELLWPMLSEMGATLAVEEPGEVAATPLEFALDAPYPNPFNPETNVAFTLPSRSHVRLSVFNVLGREVMRAVEGERSAGRHIVSINLQDFGSGTYFIRLKSDQGTLLKRAVLLK